MSVPTGKSHYTTRWGAIDPHSMPMPPAGVWLSHLVKPSHAVRLGFDEQTLVLYASPCKSEVEGFFQVLGERMNAEPMDIEPGDSFDLLAWADANMGSACPVRL
ncbi:hypothetical protein [Rhodoferax sp.]|uniref:hypothetical protein n=1 Tax=Rhodoferax sp. TaxID=50421 RepID=UPI0025E82614|nr:hypothetical protein [Rhodoferax sp.]